MTRQDRHEAQGGATLWKGGPAVSSDAPDGSIAQDQPARDAALDQPPPVTLALLERGQDRYRIFCTACHGEDGGGGGRVVQRGFPRPAAFGAQDHPRRTVDVITHGSGVMYPFADRIEPSDRWAIAAYVEALKRLRAGQSTGKGA
ncbi:cytochrome c [Sphingomonas sp. CGMCC 1.13654]|uniref:Cytochrome c n=2 Tax=Sphingomonas chungangi TaxID=2683589 RepID=A0A838LA13_9SPHN|nr:cytochrome c [Sphingomonas chungangi]MBA2935555.1 cytochrome c [Sphingomonas chungangi]MVW54248.1 cytochrome c [Sphingomonas chungangi]